jgi:ubiquinone/menaquinone biosynthesis C-methylase UbiE
MAAGAHPAAFRFHSGRSAMTQQTDFDRWLRGAHTPAHARRTAQANAAFLLPHLRPGMRLLDCGCGPGSITIGLAQAVAPGETVGIDASPDAIEAARTLGAAQSCDNVRFEVADVCALPFDDASFDAVFSHAVLQHLPDPLAAVREMRRVLAPGGIAALADADHDGSVIYPDDPLLLRTFEILRELRLRSGGGDPRVGKRLRALLHQAGFTKTQGFAVANCDATSESTARTGAWWASYTESPQMAERATSLAVSDARELSGIAAAWRAWAAHPGAYWATFWCQALGWAE